MFKKIFFEKTVLSQAAKLPGTSDFFKKKQKNEKKFCPRQQSCPGQVVSSKINRISGKGSAPGSEAAWDKWLLQKNEFLEKVLHQAAKLPRTSDFFKKNIDFLEEVLHQAAKLPATSGFL